MTASAGGSHRGTCRPPARAGIDWIFATPDLVLDSHQAVRASGTSDHPLVLTRAVTSGSSLGAG